MSVLINFHFQPFRKRVNDGKSYAVKPAGYFISAASEFTAGVKFGKNNFYRGNFFRMMNCGRDASAVIFNGTRTVGVYYYGNGIPIRRSLSGDERL